jgi:hypothetical protein
MDVRQPSNWPSPLGADLATGAEWIDADAFDSRASDCSSECPSSKKGSVMTSRLKIRYDARNRRERLARREKRAMRMFREGRLLSVLFALPPRPIVTVVPLAAFLMAIRNHC